MKRPATFGNNMPKEHANKVILFFLKSLSGKWQTGQAESSIIFKAIMPDAATENILKHDTATSRL